MTEETLARRLREGRREALEQAVRAYTPYVSAVAFRALGGGCSPEDLEELTADVFLSLWQRREGLDPAKGVRAYLAAAARNRAVDLLRRRPQPLPLTADLPDGRPTPEEAAVRGAQAELLHRSIQRMDEPDRTLFFRYYYEDEPLKDVARDLGLNLSTAKTRLARGRARLRQILEEGRPF